MDQRIVDHWNRSQQEDGARLQRRRALLEQVIADPYVAFPAAVRPLLPELAGRTVCIPSSGDNYAAFACHLLGARVTSCDLAERQLNAARSDAQEHGWDIDFRLADSMTLAGVPDGVYDLVYTSNGVHVWIRDLPGMYRQFCRVLKPGGRYVGFDTHPMICPFDDSEDHLSYDYLYSDAQQRKADGGRLYDWRQYPYAALPQCVALAAEKAR